jgi:hypothetical protein
VTVLRASMAQVRSSRTLAASLISVKVLGLLLRVFCGVLLEMSNLQCRFNAAGDRQVHERLRINREVHGPIGHGFEDREELFQYIEWDEGRAGVLPVLDSSSSEPSSASV